MNLVTSYTLSWITIQRSSFVLCFLTSVIENVFGAISNKNGNAEIYGFKVELW